MFIVWSCKTLQNYKCLASTTVSGDGIYVEYTDGSEDYITNISVKNIPLNYKQIGTQKFSAEEHYKKKMLAFKLESKIYENKYNELLNLLRKANSELSEDEFYEKLNVLLKKTRNK